MSDSCTRADLAGEAHTCSGERRVVGPESLREFLPHVFRYGLTLPPTSHA
jgi:hypothetical protein